MDFKDLTFLLDLAKEEEMRNFNTKNIQLRETKEYKQNDLKASKMFWFQTNEEDELWFQISIGKFRKELMITFDVSSFYKNGWSTGFDEVFLAHKYEEIKPFISYFEELEKKMREEVKNHPKTRIWTLTNEIVYINHIEIKYVQMHNYYHHPDYKKRVEKEKNILKKLKVI